MKRFVTYLYECERGNKTKNVGFIRVNVRDEKTVMEVYIRNLVRAKDSGRIYALIYKEELFGVELGEINIKNGQCDYYIEGETEDVKGHGFSLQEIEGIGIRLESGVYIVSCWKDEYAEYMVRNDFKVKKQEEPEVQNTLVAAEECTMDEPQQTTRYEKIDLSQIRDLPSPNWHLATNSFLVHGFWNYGYLVLKEGMEENKKTLALGVPGIYEKPEAVMAILFGFPHFEAITQEMVALQKEKNQETKDGTFGCWFVDLKI